MIPVEIAGLAVDVLTSHPVVILKEIKGTRILPIWIGGSEATAIAVKLDHIDMPRPLTHDLLKTVIEGLDGRVKKIIISDIRENTFFAKIVIDRKGDLFSIDARPSDSIALALRTKSPIFVQEELVNMDLDLSQFKLKTEDDELESLSDYLSKLDPEDLGRLDPDAE